MVCPFNQQNLNGIFKVKCPPSSLVAPSAPVSFTERNLVIRLKDRKRFTSFDLVTPRLCIDPMRSNAKYRGSSLHLNVPLYFVIVREMGENNK